MMDYQKTDCLTKQQKDMNQVMVDLQLDDAPAGGCLLVYQQGKWIINSCVGQANKNVLWSPHTLALNFSAGKAVLVTLVHVLVSKGLLDYDKPICVYWQDFAVNGKQNITLRQVLNHQANLFAVHGLVSSHQQMLDWQFMLNVVANMPVQQPIGLDNKQGSAYSALVFGWLLGGLIEAVTGLSLQQALQTYLTEPLEIQDEVFFELPAHRFNEVAQPVKNFDVTHNTHNTDSKKTRSKPVLKPDSTKTLTTYANLPCYQTWQRQIKQNVDKTNKLTTADINQLYFNTALLNIKNYTMSLMANTKENVDYYKKDNMMAKIPAVNCVASATGLATIYAMLANGGNWSVNNNNKTLINATQFKELSCMQVTGFDVVMPAKMGWRLGYHKLLSVTQPPLNITKNTDTGFGHIGYNGAYAWCDPSQKLAMAYVHNYDVTMLTDIRAFALTELVLGLADVNTV